MAVGGRLLSTASSALRGDRRCSKEDLGALVAPPEGLPSLSLSFSLSLFGYLIADGAEGADQSGKGKISELSVGEYQAGDDTVECRNDSKRQTADTTCAVLQW